MLLDKGAPINAMNNDDETPLFYAARKSHHRVVRMLMRRGADATIENKYRDTAQEEALDERTQGEFNFTIRDTFPLGQEEIKTVLSYLNLKELTCALTVSDRWHRAAEDS